MLAQPKFDMHQAPYRGHACVTYHRIDGLTVCPYAEEDPDWDLTIVAWPVTWHVVYARTRHAVDFGDIKDFFGEREGRESIVEETVSELVAELRHPAYELANVFVACDERHAGNYSRDVTCEEFSVTSPCRIYKDTVCDIVMGRGLC